MVGEHLDTLALLQSSPRQVRNSRGMKDLVKATLHSHVEKNLLMLLDGVAAVVNYCPLFNIPNEQPRLFLFMGEVNLQQQIGLLIPSTPKLAISSSSFLKPKHSMRGRTRATQNSLTRYRLLV